MYYRISKNEKILFFGKKSAQVWAVTLNEFNTLKVLTFWDGVICFMWQIVISERLPTSLNLETQEVSNLCHGLQ